MGVVRLLQNHYCVLQVVVYKVDTEVLWSLVSHIQIKKSKEHPPKFMARPTTSDFILFMVTFPKADGEIRCPVGGCKGWETTRTNLCIHFIYHHLQYTVVILE